jgi:RNA polymerase sigma-70 factor (ECF subfamily)
MPTAATAAGSRLPSPDSDRDLVAQLLSGDEQAFADLVRRYHGPLLRFARIFVATPDVAEEVVQDGWLAVLTGLPAFEGRSSLKSWVFGIVANKAKTRGARERRTIAFADLTTNDEDGTAVDGDRFLRDGGWRQPPARWDGNTPEAQLLRREAVSIVERVLADLPPAQRAVVTLRDVEDLDAAETCNMLGITETNQRVLLHRGRSKIRAALEDSAAKGR